METLRKRVSVGDEEFQEEGPKRKNAIFNPCNVTFVNWDFMQHLWYDRSTLERMHIAQVWYHCSQVGPHLGTRVPMGTFFSFWVPKRSPFSLFQAEERVKSQSIHYYLLNVDHLNLCDGKTSFNYSHASSAVKLSLVHKYSNTCTCIADTYTGVLNHRANNSQTDYPCHLHIEGWIYRDTPIQWKWHKSVHHMKAHSVKMFFP